MPKKNRTRTVHPPCCFLDSGQKYGGPIKRTQDEHLKKVPLKSLDFALKCINNKTVGLRSI